MIPDPSEHKWACGQFAAYAAGLLEGSNADRFEQHAAHCEECREQLSAVVDPEANRGRHIPDSLIASWPRAQASLRGLQREIVRRHLSTCGECGTILRHMGYSPQLEHLSELEPSSEMLLMLAGAKLDDSEPEPAPRPVMRVVKPAWSRRERWLGVWGGLATAAAAVLVVAIVERPGTESTTGAVVTPSPSVGHLTSAASGQPSDSPRGAGGAAQPIHVRAGERLLSILIQPGDLQKDERVVAELSTASGPLAMDTLSSADFADDRTLVWNAPGPITPGDYRLVLRTPARSDTFAFRVERH